VRTAFFPVPRGARPLSGRRRGSRAGRTAGSSGGAARGRSLPGRCELGRRERQRDRGEGARRKICELLPATPAAGIASAPSSRLLRRKDSNQGWAHPARRTSSPLLLLPFN
uniref:Uncharacterized protein n=1 Tax=Pavo cristatus TaxID=9049 RepID=A0A8C9G7E8_PAVCR